MAGDWIAGGARTTGARLRLFCFAHAGGGSVLYRGWRQALEPDIDVCPVVLPGRESRIREVPFNRMEDLVESLFEGLRDCVDRPYTMFGHSMGAAVAYELARRFAASAVGEPLRLFVSGRRAPQLPSRRRLFSDLPDEQFLAELVQLNGTPPEVLRQHGLLELFLPCLRADVQLNERYRPLAGETLSCPISALAGDADPEVDADEVAGWRDVTTGPFSLRVFDGDHFYLNARRSDVLAAIRTDVGRMVARERVSLAR